MRVSRTSRQCVDADSQLKIVIDQEKAGASASDLRRQRASSSIFAGDDVNDFILGDDSGRFIVQGDAPLRMQPEDIDDWYARNARARWCRSPPSSPRGRRARRASPASTAARAQISGAAAAPAPLRAPRWTAMESSWPSSPAATASPGPASYQERLSGIQAPYLYALSILVVFLCLAALYESWTIPLSVILAVPVGVLGALPPPAFRPVERRLLQGRPPHHDRPCRQERDPDRRVRRRTGSGGRSAPRRHRRGRAAPPPPDPDDLARLHPRRPAARHRHRRRLRARRTPSASASSAASSPRPSSASSWCPPSTSSSAGPSAAGHSPPPPEGLANSSAPEPRRPRLRVRTLPLLLLSPPAPSAPTTRRRRSASPPASPRAAPPAPTATSRSTAGGPASTTRR